MGAFNDYRDQAEAALVLGYLSPSWTPLKLFAGGVQGSWLPTLLGQMFEDAAGTLPAEDNDDVLGRINDQSGNGNNVTQSTTSFKPKLKLATLSRKYDGADDYLAGTAKCGASGNTLAAKVTAPAAVASAQAIAGLTSASGRFFVLIGTDGKLAGGVGSNSTGVIAGTTDVRGQTGIVTLVEDGTNVYLYWNNNLEYSGARNGAPSTTLVYHEGAINNGSGNLFFFFFSGEIHDRVTLQRGITDAERAQLLTYWS